MKFIFEIRIRNGHTEQEYIDAWKKGSGIIQVSEGAEGTVLYRKIGEPGTLLAIASWESKEVRDVAMKKLDEAGLEVKEVLDNHNNYGDTNIIGNFEEIARVEPPRDS
ncbi:MAG: antibiotic biosynthesis monooxygenase [Candidatus Levybacteria bacterium]|nr:antibiotic biosynthesis monooxygenase [Candidatus Levybacteria bacterium]